jgi:hypothetical protein
MPVRKRRNIEVEDDDERGEDQRMDQEDEEEEEEHTHPPPSQRSRGEPFPIRDLPSNVFWDPGPGGYVNVWSILERKNPGSWLACSVDRQ